MPPCPSCGAELDTRWKFCIYCGSVLESTRTGRTVPGAIRPTDVAAVAPRTRLDVPLLIGMVLGLAGVALLVYLGILLFGPG